MRENFDGSLVLYLKTEGGYVNDPADRGGPTNKGITLATARLYIAPNFTIGELKALTDAQAGIVYKRNYWDACRCDELDSGVDYCIGDYAINSGPKRAITVLQTLVGATVDGRMGPKTIAAADAYMPNDLIAAICDERIRFMKGLGKSWERFGPGWTNRVNGVKVHSLALAKAGAPTAVSAYAAQYIDQAVILPTGKAVPESPVKGQTQTAIAGAAATVGAFGTAHHFGGYIAMGLAFGMVGITAVSIAALQARLNASATTPVGPQGAPLTALPKAG